MHRHEFFQGDKGPFYLHTCICNDESRPPALLSEDAFTCLSIIKDAPANGADCLSTAGASRNAIPFAVSFYGEIFF